MIYGTPSALRMALEQRLLTRANETGINLDRLRRRVLFERIVARLEAAEPGRWVLKGGMALERLAGEARATIEQASATLRKARQSIPVAFGRRRGNAGHG